MIRIETTKDGTLQVWVGGKLMKLPDRGQCVVLMPRTKFATHLENSSDSGGDTT